MKEIYIISLFLWCLIMPFTLYGQANSFFRIERKLLSQELYDELPNDTTWSANVIISDSLAVWKMERAGFDGKWVPYIPTMEEIRSMETCIRASYPQLISFMKDHWVLEPWNLVKSDCYTRFFRQYMFLKDPQGRKMLHLCCLSFVTIERFIRSVKDIKESPLMLSDGGDNFWQAVYDIETKQALWVYVNGSR